MEPNKNDTKELIHKTETDPKTSKPNLWLPKGKHWERGEKWEVGLDIYTLPQMEWMSSKDLLHRTRYSTQYSVVTYMGKESEKQWVYAHV